MADKELLDKIRRCDDWYYEFDVAGYKTPLRRSDSAARHPERKAYFFDPVVDLLGGSLRGKRVLDLGCNQGFFSLCAAENDCDFVLGIDASAKNVERAGLIFEAKEISRDRYQFRCDDFFRVLNGDAGDFHVVFALGVLHWLEFADHVKFLEAAVRHNTDLFVVDTVVSLAGGPLLELRRKPLGERDPHPGGRLRILPTCSGLLEMMRDFGYAGVVLQPRFTDWTGSEDYRDGVRRAFLFARQTCLRNLSVPVEPASGHEDAARMLDVSAKTLARALMIRAMRKVGLCRS